MEVLVLVGQRTDLGLKRGDVLQTSSLNLSDLSTVSMMKRLDFPQLLMLFRIALQLPQSLKHSIIRLLHSQLPFSILI
jgi:hypothetical protein